MSEDTPKPTSRRGGKRLGAGRKKKDHAAASVVAGLDLKTALAAPPPEEIETARVSAGRALWDRGLGTAATARVPDDFAGVRPIGKKQEAARAAKTAGEGTAWGDDLRPPSTAGQGIN